MFEITSMISSKKGRFKKNESAHIWLAKEVDKVNSLQLTHSDHQLRNNNSLPLGEKRVDWFWTQEF